MSDDQDGCEWVSLSSVPDQRLLNSVCVCVCVHYRIHEQSSLRLQINIYSISITPGPRDVNHLYVLK